MNTQTIRDIINKRIATDDESQNEVDQCWEELSTALACDYEAARKFLLEDCTADEASWVSEVYEEIIEKTQDERYLELLRKSVARFPEENKEYRMSEILELVIDSHYLGPDSPEED